MTAKRDTTRFIDTHKHDIVNVALCLFVEFNAEDCEFSSPDYFDGVTVAYSPKRNLNRRFLKSQLPSRKGESYNFLVNPSQFPEDWIGQVATELMKGPLGDVIWYWVANPMDIDMDDRFTLHHATFMWILEEIAPMSVKSIVRLKTNDYSMRTGTVRFNAEPAHIGNLIAEHGFFGDFSVIPASRS